MIDLKTIAGHAENLNDCWKGGFGPVTDAFAGFFVAPPQPSPDKQRHLATRVQAVTLRFVAKFLISEKHTIGRHE